MTAGLDQESLVVVLDLKGCESVQRKRTKLTHAGMATKIMTC
jgi:hypothetical protein